MYYIYNTNENKVFLSSANVLPLTEFIVFKWNVHDSVAYFFLFVFY